MRPEYSCGATHDNLRRACAHTSHPHPHALSSTGAGHGVNQYDCTKWRSRLHRRHQAKSRPAHIQHAQRLLTTNTRNNGPKPKTHQTSGQVEQSKPISRCILLTAPISPTQPPMKSNGHTTKTLGQQPTTKPQQNDSKRPETPLKLSDHHITNTSSTA